MSEAPTTSEPAGGLRWWAWPLVWLAIWGSLLALRAPILKSPPYFETAMGLYREALFLAETDFDYRRLRYDEVRVNDGGPYSYMTSVLPTLLAVAMRTLPTREDVFLAAHLFSLAAGATLATVLIGLLRRRVGGIAAMLTAAAVLSTPLVVVQMDIVSLDLAMAAAALASLSAAVAGRYGLGALLATVSFFMKATGLVATAAIFGYFVVRLAAAFYLRRRTGGFYDSELRGSIRGLVAFGLALVVQGAVHTWGGVGDRLHAILFGERWLDHFLLLCPDLLVLAAVALFGGIGFVLAAPRGAKDSSRGRFDAMVASLVSDPLVWIAGGMALLVYVAIRLYAGVFVVRYFLVVVPLLYVVAVVAWSEIARPRRGMATVLALAVAFNVANAYGQFLPEPPSSRRHCNTRERSLEYLADHESNMAAMKALAARAGDTPVVAGYPFSCFLSHPAMGYVDRPLTVYATMPWLTPNVRSAVQMLADAPRELIFISVDNPSHRVGQISPAERAPGDELIYDDQQSSPLVIYRKQIAAADAAALTDWYLDHLWFDDKLFARHESILAQRALTLSLSGRPELSAALLARCIQTRPDDPQFHVLLAEQLVTLGRFGPAQAELATARQLLGQPGAASAALAGRMHFVAGLAAFRQNQLEQAEREFRAALAADATLAEAEFLLGAIAARSGDVQRARELFEGTLRQKPDHLEALCFLGVLDQQSGDLAAAADRFAEALRNEPNYPTALVNLAAVRNAQKRPAEAIELLERATASDPRHLAAWSELSALHEQLRDDAAAVATLRQALATNDQWHEGRRRLAWLLATSWDAGTRAPDEARALAEQLAQLSERRDVGTLDALAAAEAGLQRFAEAVRTADEALALLAGQPGSESIAAGIASRRDLYRQERPYHAPPPPRL